MTTKRNTHLLARFAPALVLAVVGILTLLITGARPASIQAQTQAPGCWIVSQTDAGGIYEGLTSVTAVSAKDAWAVGSKDISEKTRALIMHWDGERWTESPNPGTGDARSTLYGVTAISANDVWAVGSYGDDLKPPVKTLVMHWDGKAWSIVPSPNASSNGSTLRAVSGISKNDVWAVGGYTSPPRGGLEQMLALHWDGTAWIAAPPPVLPTPTPGTPGPTTFPSAIYLNGVAAVASDDVWAVGIGSGSAGSIVHWNGKAWSIMPISGQPRITNLNSVTALSANDIWAVGQNEGDSLAVHWDGKQWSVVPTPSVGAQFNVLQAIAGTSSHDVWAFGYTMPDRAPEQALLMHWNGETWNLEPNPVNAPLSQIGVGGATAKGDTVWAVGAVSVQAAGAPWNPLFLQHSSSPCAALTPAPAPTTLPPTPIKPLEPPIPLPGSGSVTFTETGKTVRAAFLSYWNKNGGLPQQGYPISNLLGEVSPLNGMTYTMQYFERAVFEYHPDEKPPYNVLLSQLGTFQYRQKYPTGAPGQRPNNDPGSVSFPQTGHRVGGSFLQYWQQHGGLAQQGYPLSDEFTEVSDLNGKQYTVQYFERAVFEWHPENAPPYNVLLSQLGKFRYDVRYNQAPAPATVTATVPATPSQTPAASATPTPSATPQLIAHDVYGNVTANDRYLFWISNNRPVYSVYGYDLQENKTFLVTDRPGPKFSLASDDRSVVWGEGDVEGSAGIRGYDILAKAEFTALESTNPARIGEGRMAIDGAMLYYEGNVGGRFGIVARNITTKQGELLIERGQNPVVWGDVLMWSKEIANCTPGNSHPPCLFDQELYVRKANQDRLVSKVYGIQTPFTQYNVHNNRAVWVNPTLTGEGSAPYLYDILSDTTKQLSIHPANNPLIRDDLILWAREPDPGQNTSKTWSIEQYDPLTGSISGLLQSDTLLQTQALMGHKAVAYLLGGSKSIYGPGRGDLYLLGLGK